MKPVLRVADEVTSCPLTTIVTLEGLIAISVGAAYVAKMLGRVLLTVWPCGGATSPIAGGVVAAESVWVASARGASFPPTLSRP